MTNLGTVPPIVILGGVASVCLGGPIILYALLTRDQRRTRGEIRREAAARGWRYTGRSGGFRIEGSSAANVAWVMTSGNSGEGEMRWSSELNLRFPALRGEVDVAILPRDGQSLPATAKSPGGALAGAVGLLRGGHEVRSGVAQFDEAYEVRARQISHPPVDVALARRILHWPDDAVTPRSIVAWRDPLGFHCNARLPGPPNQATVDWLAGVGADLAARLPRGVLPQLTSG